MENDNLFYGGAVPVSPNGSCACGWSSPPCYLVWNMSGGAPEFRLKMRDEGQPKAFLGRRRRRPEVSIVRPRALRPVPRHNEGHAKWEADCVQQPDGPSRGHDGKVLIA